MHCSALTQNSAFLFLSLFTKIFLLRTISSVHIIYETVVPFRYVLRLTYASVEKHWTEVYAHRLYVSTMKQISCYFINFKLTVFGLSAICIAFWHCLNLLTASVFLFSCNYAQPSFAGMVKNWYSSWCKGIEYDSKSARIETSHSTSFFKKIFRPHSKIY